MRALPGSWRRRGRRPPTSRPSGRSTRPRSLLEDLEALLLPGARDAEDRDRLARVLAELEAGLDHAAGDDVDAGVGDDRHHHRDLLDAVLFQHLLGQAAGLGDRRVAADLGVVGGLAALAADRVGQGQRAAAGADHEAEVAARSRGPCPGSRRGGRRRRSRRRCARSRRARRSRGCRPRRSRAACAAAPSGGRPPRSPSPCGRRGRRSCRRSSSASGLISARVMSLSRKRRARRARIGVARLSCEPVTPVAAIDLLGLEVGDRQQVGDVAAADVVGVGLGDLLDVDPAHVAEQHQRPLRGAVPDDARVVLLLDLGFRVDEDAARHVAVDLQLEDRLGVLGGLLGRVGELDAAGLHPAAAQHLRLDHDRPADLLGGRRAPPRRSCRSRTW